MSSRNSVAIITSPRPRVGKTLLARLLTDFHLEEGRPVAAFDLNAGEGTLAHSCPSTSRSSIDDLKGQMALFDCLMTEDDATKIADLGQVSFERFFTLAFQFGLAEEARRRGIVPMLLYLMSPDRRSVEAYRDLCRRLPEAMLAPVHNEIFGVAQYGNKYVPIGSGTVIVRLPLLAANVRKYVERPPFSFAASKAAAFDVDAYIELKHWLQRIYREFRDLDLRILLAAPRHTPIQQSG